MLEVRWGTSGLLTPRRSITAGAVALALTGLWFYTRPAGADGAVAKLAAEGNVEALGKIARGSDDARAMRAASALGTLAKDPRTGGILLSLLKDSRPPVRERVVLSIAKTPVPRQHAKIVMDVLRSDPSPAVRAAAAEALGQMKAVEAVPVLADALSDQDIVYDRSRVALKNIMGVIPGFSERDSPARRQKMARYYRTFHFNYGRAIQDWQALNEQQPPPQEHKP
ncbi:MAG: HEAT repeat domain-containing protein [Planctomycetaceae bacterium]|nr:HEAT repeat domain-containing protein [Planctomycetaceae bacterium]